MSVALAWSTATVHDGTLDVELRGELPRGWKASFNRTVALLGGGDWGPVRLKKDRIQVPHVVAGSEERVHHFLESVVLEANAARGVEDDEGADEPVEDESERVDREMTQQFRSYGTQSGD